MLHLVLDSIVELYIQNHVVYEVIFEDFLYNHKVWNSNFTHPLIDDDFNFDLYVFIGILGHINLLEWAEATDHLPEDYYIHRLVPARDRSFYGFRVVFTNKDHSGYYHQYFSSVAGYIGIPFHTDYHVAFNSYYLNYLVTFANLSYSKNYEARWNI